MLSLRFRILLLTLFVAEVPCLQAQTAPYLVWDDSRIGTNRSRASWWRSAAMGSWHFFVGAHPSTGIELWKSDGTEGGTSLVADICPGACSSHPSWLVVAEDQVFFSAWDGEHGVELWVSDGTATGTRLVRDFLPGPDHSSPFVGLALGDSVLTIPHLLNQRKELWITDGTASGTVMLRATAPFELRAATTDFALFTSENQSGGHVLWVSDGTPAGTKALLSLGKDLFDATRYSPTATLDGLVLFLRKSSSGRTLWRTDGTLAGTREIAVPEEVELPLVTVGDAAFGMTASGILVTDGETATVSAVPGWSADDCSFFVPAVSLGKAFFLCDGLWATDLTGPGTVKLSDVAGWPYAFDSGVWFQVSTPNTSPSESEAWVSDGTLAGTHPLGVTMGYRASLLDQIASGQERGFLVSGFGVGKDLWSTDGTTAGTRRIWPKARLSSSGIHPQIALPDGRAQVQTSQGPLVFGGPGSVPAPSASVTDLEQTGLIGPFVPFQGRHYVRSFYDRGPFGAYPDGRATVQSVDANLQGTRQVTDLFLLSLHPFFGELLGVGSPGFGPAGGAVGLRYLQPDGSPSAASLPDAPDQTVCTNSPFKYGVYSETLDPVRLANRLFLPANQGLWSIDDQLQTADWAPFLEETASLAATDDGRIIFAATTPNDGREIWSYDPVSNSLLQLDVRPGARSGLFRPQTCSYNVVTDRAPDNRPLVEPNLQLRRFAQIGDLYFFVGDDGTHGVELWVTTADGPPHLLDIAAGAASSFPDALTVVRDRLMFRANDGTYGVELWTSDGTPGGTHRLLDARPGPASALPQELQELDDHLLFTQFDEVAGRELWLSDGTAQGTRRVSDLAEGTESSSPSAFLATSDRVFFRANDGVRGFELWALERPVGGRPGDLFSSGFESAATGDWSVALP